MSFARISCDRIDDTDAAMARSRASSSEPFSCGVPSMLIIFSMSSLLKILKGCESVSCFDLQSGKESMNVRNYRTLYPLPTSTSSYQKASSSF
ncbi:unnamed protein product [Haemonchus placei]|uniref:Uncharacterized protein n=1 Tax=Haemonchus placei TaxID=6290 RepID=A0A3P8BX16_HAEPC|nr:unnamed protein product [Haemonchus placei]